MRYPIQVKWMAKGESIDDSRSNWAATKPVCLTVMIKNDFPIRILYESSLSYHTA